MEVSLGCQLKGFFVVRIVLLFGWMGGELGSIREGRMKGIHLYLFATSIKNLLEGEGIAIYFGGVGDGRSGGQFTIFGKKYPTKLSEIGQGFSLKMGRPTNRPKPFKTTPLKTAFRHDNNLRLPLFHPIPYRTPSNPKLLLIP